MWITYDPDLDGDDVTALAGRLPDNGILSPYDGLPGPVVVTVWGRQLRLTGADDPRLALFLASSATGTPRPSRSPPATAASPPARPHGPTPNPSERSDRAVGAL